MLTQYILVQKKIITIKMKKIIVDFGWFENTCMVFSDTNISLDARQN